MKKEEATVARTEIRLAEYRPPAWLVPSVELTFRLDPDATEVEAEVLLERNSEGPHEAPVLLGEGLELLGLSIDGREVTVPSDEAQLEKGRLTLSTVTGERALVRTRVRIAPAQNTSLEGLYMSGGNFCTQNEPEGFRHITFFPDRPDVMSRYRTRIEADAREFPILLSNGNRISQEDLGKGRHAVVWEDPFPKPSYLFALVAGDLGRITGEHVTSSGRRIALEIYTDKGSEERAAFALESLRQAMIWDEQVFGLEYDLDIYMIVAVEDFNFGAMENKGLNVFNASLVLADPRTATDETFERIQGVVAHEYFHNWTGNRVTCRDWFQLTLKEGLTVFRDQQFTADMTSPDLKRIYDVDDLRQLQFPEDAGPMAHPIQPKAYIEINNFYTMTVYEKGAEVIRMIHTLIGPRLFRKGIDLYFERHDGHAVTTEDFVAAMQDASGTDLRAFRRWYDQKGTPHLHVRTRYLPDEEILELQLKQSNPAEPAAEPLVMPLRLALFSSDGRQIEFEPDFELPPADLDQLPGAALRVREATLPFDSREATHRIAGVSEAPQVSVLRGFSAPVELHFERSDEDLAFLMAHDSDGFNRREAGRELALRVLDASVGAVQKGDTVSVPDHLVEAIHSVLESEADESLRAVALALPPEALLNQRMSVADFSAVHRAREAVLRGLGDRLEQPFRQTYQRLHAAKHPTRLAGVGARRLKNTCLAYLVRLANPQLDGLLYAQLESAENMTDELAALRLLQLREGDLRERGVKLFYERWRDESLVLNYWLAVQAASPLPGTLERVRQLTQHESFNWKNPNRVRSLLGSFARNELHFNAADGSGYEFVADCILELDALNPSTASGLSKAFTRMARLDQERAERARQALGRVRARAGLSNDVFEIVSRCLDA